MEEDISKTTVIVLLILTIVVSILGTWTVLDGITSTKVTVGGEPQKAKIGFSIPEEPQTSSSSTEVKFNVLS